MFCQQLSECPFLWARAYTRILFTKFALQSDVSFCKLWIDMMRKVPFVGLIPYLAIVMEARVRMAPFEQIG